ncbi:hypothetical protein COHA_006170 [Chlorella ohadii]|uniref:Uncharacterized protein n=1 Tax=Chlorella ohadii TaxID=2649997 RepID=A0AAD5DND2_9CHLO|nr:hypothetical protein COHA_006170 [Chlorella ohadii]
MPPNVEVTMQAVPPPQPPLPQRWAAAVQQVEAAQQTLDSLINQLDGALYLDDEAWQQALPHAQFTAALQGQQRKIAELEQQVQALVVKLEASERARAEAEERCRQLGSEVEGSASVFKLHYEELMRKDREISDLQAVIQALSLGGGSGGGKGGGGSSESGGSVTGGSDAGGSDSEPS